MIKILKNLFLFIFFVSILFFSFFLGYLRGISKNTKFNFNISKLVFQNSEIQATPIPIVVNQSAIPSKKISWTGPELWAAVNKRRVEFGVNPLNNASELCTIAAIRLNDLLDLGKLDGHEGFGKMPENREDLKWIFEKYNSVSEFLLSGAETTSQAVSMWENTLGHKKLLDGGEYVWGCIYAQEGFAVAITAY